MSVIYGRIIQQFQFIWFLTLKSTHTLYSTDVIEKKGAIIAIQ